MLDSLVKKGCLVFLSLVAVTATAEELIIESFDSSGTLVFNQISNAANYRVEWASSPSGPWTNSWEHLSTIQPQASGSVTCKVAMCYRVIAELAPNPFKGTMWDMSLPEGSELKHLKLYSDGTAELIEYDKDEYSSYPVIGSGLKIYSGTYSVSGDSLSAVVVVDWRIFDPSFSVETMTITGTLTSDSEISGTANYVDTSPSDPANVDFSWSATKSSETP